MTAVRPSATSATACQTTGDLTPAAAPVQVGEETYDASVADAVRAFQQRRGLLADGIVGPQTYRALDGARWSLGDRILIYAPGHLLSGDDVAELQEQLLRLGFHVGRVDGLFGPSTESALRELQRGVGLVPDGTCGPATLRALAQLLTRSVSGGAAHQLRETETVRQAGPSPGRPGRSCSIRVTAVRDAGIAGRAASARPTSPWTWPAGSRAGWPPPGCSR